jgi:putative Mg2+ transporter-C (MgtC) family protein
VQTEVTGSEVAVRLLLSFAAGAILGANRSEHGSCLLQTTGKTPDSFVTMDVMRLPLGILTGMGFIGAGAP